MTTSLETWLERLGYSDAPESLHSLHSVPTNSAYAAEIDALLSNNQEVPASAIFSVDGVPTICFVEAKTDQNAYALVESIRRKIWNQSLISLILVIDEEYVLPVAATRGGTQVKKIRLKDAVANGPFSMLDVVSGDIEARVPDWFSKESRVDRDLLRNLSVAVSQLEQCGMARQDAQYVLGRCLFISFLEHRGIVGDPYRQRRNVDQLHALINSRDRDGLTRLLDQLKSDFNGDFLQPDATDRFDWALFSDVVFECLADFLCMVDLESKQLSFWAYDFRYIPVELISGIYETFLDASNKKLTGAYYTPRHLANFAVDQVFEGVQDICSEIVYDGACGSGILLATAYRRMVRAAANRKGSPIGFHERCNLLLDHIRGSDIDETACRVSAFSLYLCLLENLEPIDIALLQDDANVKLPPLLDVILLYGPEKGDFFSDKNRFSQPGSCTIYLSNPPWAEASGKQKHSFETWGDALHKVMSHRNIAIGFAHRAAMTLKERGRFCLIMNAKPFLSRSSQGFLKQWLADVSLQRLINFSDIRRLLFPAAIHPCVLAVGSARIPRQPLSGKDEFEYWTPKSDISLAFGRLTVHGIDRHLLQTSAIMSDNQRLRSFFWGGAHDHALIARLRLGGIVSDLLTAEEKGQEPRWLDGKGFHALDSAREPQDPVWLKKLPFYNASSKPEIPLLDPQLLEDFPEKFETVASFGAHQGKLFRGPRVIFNDGADGTFEPQAFFSETDFSFQSSVGAFQGPAEDADLLRFFAIYLRSKLAKYLLLHTSYALATERTRVTMVEVGTLPFPLPPRHRDPSQARETIAQVAQTVIRLEQADSLTQPHLFAQMRDTFDSLIYDYFGLSEVERTLVEEVVAKLIPSVQPASLAAIHKPTLARATAAEVKQYVEVLQTELQRIQSRLDGRGGIAVEALVQSHSIGPIGIVRIALTEKRGAPTYGVQDAAVVAALAWLKEQQVLPMPAGESFNLASDFLFFANDAIYLAKPLISRFWLVTQALRDSHRVMEAIRHAAVGQGSTK